MLKVGLTGGIASGKSTVSTLFKEANIKVIEADLISREIYILYPELIKKIEESFGKNFITENGQVKRRVLGEFVFTFEQERKKLENIVMPYIIKEIFRRFDEYNRMGNKICILDAPTLIENDLHKYMDYNILVWVDDETQILRLINRDNLSYESALKRIKAQMSTEEKKKLVDIVIDNNFEFINTKKQVNDIIKRLENKIKLENKN
jgi:dephospho-CoA kinase